MGSFKRYRIFIDVEAYGKAESYSEAFQVIEMESFDRTVNGFKPSTIFTRKLHHRSFAGF